MLHFSVSRGFRAMDFLSVFFFVMFFYKNSEKKLYERVPVLCFFILFFLCYGFLSVFLKKKSLELFWKILMNFLKSPYEFLEKSLWISLKNPYGFFYCYGFSSSFFFAKSKKTITIKISIWFFLKNSYGLFLKIHMVFF